MKTDLRFGVLTKNSPTIIHNEWDPTFVTYLTERLGHLNITTQLVTIHPTQMVAAIGRRELDFMFSHPGIFTCAENEFEATAVVSIETLRLGRSLTSFGGQIVVKASRADLNTVTDLRNKTVAGIAPAGLGGFQMQWRVLKEAGVDIFADVRKIMFSKTQDNSVYDVLSGDSDAAFIRADQLERMEASGKIASIHQFRILSPRMSPKFPFNTTTKVLYPDWVLSAGAHVPTWIQKAVARALLDMPRLHAATVSGKYTQWLVPLSMRPVHVMQKALNLVRGGVCVDARDMENIITCADGYQLVPPTLRQCDCPANRRCLCQPCVRAPAPALLPSSTTEVLHGLQLSAGLRFSLVLASFPTADVTVSLLLSSSQGMNANLSRTTLRFSQATALQPQFVNVSVAAVAGPGQSVAVDYQLVSQDGKYNGLCTPPLRAVVSWPACTADDWAIRVEGCADGQRTVWSQWRHVAFAGGSTSCHAGLPLPPPINIGCDVVDSGSGLSAFVIGTALLLAIPGLLFALFVGTHWNNPTIRLSQPPFMLVLVFALLLGIVGLLMTLGAPTSFTCLAHPALLSVAFTMFYGGLFAKTLRVYRLVGAMRRKTVSLGPTLALLLLIVTFDLLLHAVWAVVDPPQPVVVNTPVVGVGVVPFRQCALGSGSGATLMWVSMCYKVCIALAGCWTALKTRHLADELSEATYTFLAVYNMLFLSLIVGPLLLFGAIGGHVAVVVECVGVVLILGGSFALIAVPKVVLSYSSATAKKVSPYRRSSANNAAPHATSSIDNRRRAWGNSKPPTVTGERPMTNNVEQI